MKIQVKARVLAFALASHAQACSGGAVTTEPSTKAPESADTSDVSTWVNTPPREALRGEFSHRLAQSKIAIVADDACDEAIRRLERVDWVRLSESEIEHFAGRKLEIGTDEIPALLRGTTRAHSQDRLQEFDKLNVVWKDGAVITMHVCRRHAPDPPMIRVPVVAVLPAEPSTVYTSSFVSLF